MPPHPTHIRDVLTSFFDETELRNLYFDMQIDYEELSGSGKVDKARGLVLLCQRHDRYDELVDMCQKLRPHAFESDSNQYVPSSPLKTNSNSKNTIKTRSFVFSISIVAASIVGTIFFGQMFIHSQQPQANENTEVSTPVDTTTTLSLSANSGATKVLSTDIPVLPTIAPSVTPVPPTSTIEPSHTIQPVEPTMPVAPSPVLIIPTSAPLEQSLPTPAPIIPTSTPLARFQITIDNVQTDESVSGCSEKRDSEIYAYVFNRDSSPMRGAVVRISTIDESEAYDLVTNEQGGVVQKNLRCALWKVKIISIPGISEFYPAEITITNINGLQYTLASVVFRLD